MTVNIIRPYEYMSTFETREVDREGERESKESNYTVLLTFSLYVV